MPRVTIGPALPDRETLNIEIARLRDLDIEGLLSRWHAVFGRRHPLTFRAIFCFVCWRIGCRPTGTAILMPRTGACSIIPERRRKLRGAPWVSSRRSTEVRPGTVFGREWKGQMHQVAVLADGFAWNGKTYPSLSKVAFAITGTRWNGPRFFGLRDKPSKVRST